MRIDQLKPNAIVRGPILPEPVQNIVTIPMGPDNLRTNFKLISSEYCMPVLGVIFPQRVTNRYAANFALSQQPPRIEQR